MKWLFLSARLILGGIFFVFGLNGFLQFLPVPPLAPQAGELMRILGDSGWLYVVKTIEVAGGALLLSGYRVPLGMTLLAPIVVNIALFHLLLDPGNLPMAVVLTVTWLVLFYRYRAAFAGVLGRRGDDRRAASEPGDRSWVPSTVSARTERS